MSCLGKLRRPFLGRGVTQGGPLLAKLFNIIVDAVVREWHRIVRGNTDVADEGELDHMMVALFAVFNVDDKYVACSRPSLLAERARRPHGHIRLCWP